MTELLSKAHKPLEKALKDKSQSVKKYHLAKRMKMKLVELKKALKTKQFQKLFRSCIRSSKRWKMTLQNSIKDLEDSPRK